MKRYKQLFNEDHNHWIDIKFSDIEKLEEELRISDLMKNAGMSQFTQKFAKETNKLMGTASQRARLVQMKVNLNKDYITFIWLTERTPKYKDNFNTNVVIPKTWELKKDNLYTIEIRILDFFKHLQKLPDYPSITNENIENIFLKANCQIWSDVPAFEFQGMNYTLSLFDASIYPENRPPKYWNKYHNSDQFVDKHTGSIINSIKFYIPQMRQMILKYILKNK